MVVLVVTVLIIRANSIKSYSRERDDKRLEGFDGEQGRYSGHFIWICRMRMEREMTNGKLWNTIDIKVKRTMTDIAKLGDDWLAGCSVDKCRVKKR